MNEIERVVAYIRSCRNAGTDSVVAIDKSRAHLILNALDKQIPKKVIRDELEYDICPVCRGYMTSENNYCHCCGQKLEWN